MKITCLGSGAFSTGIISLLKLKKENEITMWTHDKNLIKELELNIKDIKITSNLEEALKDSKILFILVSSIYIKDLITNLSPYIKKDTKIYIGTKGLVIDKLLTDYLKEQLHIDCYYLAGPNLAKDLINTKPIGITVSPYDNSNLASIMPDIVNIDYTKNTQALEIFSIYKNIIAIASGLINELTNSYSTTITLLTKAYKELCASLNNFEVLYGTTGDFYLTGTMQASRNYTFGKLLANDKKEAYLYLKNNTVEGYVNLNNFYEHNKNIVILNILNEIINKDYPATHILDYLKSN